MNLCTKLGIEINTGDFAVNAAGATPVSRTMAESVENVRAFCNQSDCDALTLRSDCQAVLTSYETLAIGQR